jgi:MYXO-CTERM domain-containing protein
MNQAAAAFESRLADSLAPISATGFDITVFDPADPLGSNLHVSNQTFAADEIRVYVGGYNASDGSLGYGGPGGYSCTGTACLQVDRGQSNATGNGATDFAPWGGTVAFNFDNNWNTRINAPLPGQYDLYSVALHELGHLLGFGTADAFDTYVTGNQFSVGSTDYPLSGDGAHWADNTMSFANGVAQEAAMTPYLMNSVRKYFTDLDYAALGQIGWQVTAVPEADTWAMFLAGLGLLGWMARRRR